MATPGINLATNIYFINFCENFRDNYSLQTNIVLNYKGKYIINIYFC